MSITALTGAFGIGRQSAKDSVASTITYIPVLQNGLEYMQTVNTLQPEVGGDYFLRGSYKASVAGSGTVNLYPRGDSIGNFLYALCGADTVTPVSGQSGAYSHVMAPFTPAAGQDLPYYTLIKNVSQVWQQQFLNAKLHTLTLDVNKQSVVSVNGGWFATTPSEVTVSSGISLDDSPVFVSCNGSITALDEATGLAISSTVDASIDRLNMSFTNNLSQDEFVVGNYYPTGITLLQRTVSLSFDVIIRDKVLWETVYQNTGTSSWSPSIRRSHLTLNLVTAANIGSTTQPWSLTLDFPGVDLMTMPVTPAGAQLLRSTVTAQVTLGSTGADRFTSTLISSQATY